MKKLLGIVLTLCLVLTLAADAFAASKPEITKQPETATTSKKGAVSFSISDETLLNMLSMQESINHHFDCKDNN